MLSGAVGRHLRLFLIRQTGGIGLESQGSHVDGAVERGVRRSEGGFQGIHYLQQALRDMLCKVDRDFGHNFGQAASLRGVGQGRRSSKVQQSDQRGFALKASVLNPVHRGKSREDEVDRHHTRALCQVDFLSLTAEWATQDLNGEGAKLVLGNFGSTLNLDAFDGDLNLARYPFVT